MHFGLGSATRVAQLIVRFPSGAFTRLANVPGDRVVTRPRAAGSQPSHAAVHRRPARELLAVTQRPVGRTSLERRRRRDASARAHAPEPGAGARPLRPLDRGRAGVRRGARRASATRRSATPPTACCSGRPHTTRTSRRRSALLEQQLRALCYSPDYTARGGSPALRSATGSPPPRSPPAGTTARTRQLHFADPTLHAAEPAADRRAGRLDACTTRRSGSRSRSRRSRRAGPARYRRACSRSSARSGAARSHFAGRISTCRAPALGDPSGAAYRQAAVAAIRATADRTSAPRSIRRRRLERGRSTACRAAASARTCDLDLALNGALNDAAVAAYGAKRRYQTPRPISMIRYLAFNGQLPLVAGLTRRDGKNDRGAAPRPLGAWQTSGRRAPPHPRRPAIRRRTQRSRTRRGRSSAAPSTHMPGTPRNSVSRRGPS